MALKNFYQTVNCNADSVINDISVLYFDASIPQSGNITINKTIENKDLYFDNKTECDKDYDDFNKKVEEIAKNM